MSKYTVDLFMQNLPETFLEDEHLRQIAEVIARCMLEEFKANSKSQIYSNLDGQEEAVLDILADDLKIDWYDYDAVLTEKTRTVKDSWYVHKRMGTKKAVERALSDIWPDSVVEEWFEYGADPFHFRVILDATEGTTPVNIDTVLKRVRLFKPARAILDADEPIMKITCGIVIETGKFSKTYHPGKCGTMPRRKSHGGKENEGLVVGTDSLTATYHVKYCGTPLGALM